MSILKSGKTLEEAIQCFRAFKKATNKKQEKYDYYKIEEYIELLDSCFGVEGYTVKYEEGNILSLPKGQAIFLSKAVVTVVDEENKPVYAFEGYGTYELTQNTEQTKFISLGTVGMNGSVNALKSACTNLGAFGSRTLSSNAGSNTGSNSNTANSQRSTRSNPLPMEVVTFYVTKAAVAGNPDANGKVMYKLTCNEVVQGNARQTPSEVLFYPNQYQGKEEKIKTFANVSRPFKVSLKVSKVNKEKDGIYATYTFKDFAS